MIEQQHTASPWHVSDSRSTIVYSKDDWPIVSTTIYHGRHEPETSAANAARIVACVNACDGLTNAELSHGRVTPLHLYSELANQRDELLAALKDIRGFCKRADLPHVGVILLAASIAEAAIAAAENK